jgi:hypothetical protein
MDKRICIKCGISYPLQEKYFALAHGSTTRFITKCRECVKEYQRQYREDKQEELSDGMYTIKEESIETQKHRMLKAFNYIHLQAFGEAMTENIYWCKKDDHVQITDEVCSKCDKTMEKIGFVDYNEGDK